MDSFSQGASDSMCVRAHGSMYTPAVCIFCISRVFIACASPESKGG